MLWIASSGVFDFFLRLRGSLQVNESTWKTTQLTFDVPAKAWMNPTLKLGSFGQVRPVWKRELTANFCWKDNDFGNIARGKNTLNAHARSWALVFQKCLQKHASCCQNAWFGWRKQWKPDTWCWILTLSGPDRIGQDPIFELLPVQTQKQMFYHIPGLNRDPGDSGEHAHSLRVVGREEEDRNSIPSSCPGIRWHLSVGTYAHKPYKNPWVGWMCDLCL